MTDHKNYDASFGGRLPAQDVAGAEVPAFIAGGSREGLLAAVKEGFEGKLQHTLNRLN